MLPSSGSPFKNGAAPYEVEGNPLPETGLLSSPSAEGFE